MYYRWIAAVLLLLAIGRTDHTVTPNVTCGAAETSQNSCQNFARNSMNELNNLITMEMEISYEYDAMSAYYLRDDVSYRGFSQFFSDLADEVRQDAKKIQRYIVKRGGRAQFKTLGQRQTEYDTPVFGMKKAVKSERFFNSKLLAVHREVDEKNDPHLLNFLESEFLNKEVERIKKMATWLTVLERFSYAERHVGWHLFDQELYEGKRK